MAFHSLKNQKQFDIVNKYGKKIFSRYFLIIAAKDFHHIEASSTNPIFLGMKVSKKLSKKAVIRNKIRRRVRHLFRSLDKNNKISIENTAFIVIPKKSFIDAGFDKLNFDLQKACFNQL